MDLESHEAFLNKMAGEGWRQAETNKLTYTFEPCEPNECSYKVIFIGEKSATENRNYRVFFEEMGYEVFIKSLNINFSFGKMRVRPSEEDGVQVVTSPSVYGKELMIIGRKQDDKPFPVFHTNESLAIYYRSIQCLYTTVLFAPAFFMAVLIGRKIFNLWAIGTTALAIILLTIPIIKYAGYIKKYEDTSLIREGADDAEFAEAAEEADVLENTEFTGDEEGIEATEEAKEIE